MILPQIYFHLVVGHFRNSLSQDQMVTVYRT